MQPQYTPTDGLNKVCVQGVWYTYNECQVYERPKQSPVCGFSQKRLATGYYPVCHLNPQTGQYNKPYTPKEKMVYWVRI